MCGIVGIVGKSDVAQRLYDGLKRLEYRGYDSAGIATLINGHIDRRRAEGKLVNLEKLIGQKPLPGTTGMTPPASARSIMGSSSAAARRASSTTSLAS